MRRVRITRRRIPLDRSDAYHAAWRDLRGLAGDRGVRAWLFRRAGRDDWFVEFLEWSGAPLLDRGPVHDALAALDELAPGRTEECEEVETTE